MKVLIDLSSLKSKYKDPLKLHKFLNKPLIKPSKILADIAYYTKKTCNKLFKQSFRLKQ